MGRGVRLGAVLGVVVAVVALWPRPSEVEPRHEVAELPEPVSVDAPPPLVRLHFEVQPHDPVGLDVLFDAFDHAGGGPNPMWAIRQLEPAGVGSIVTRAGPRVPVPPRPIRQTLTLAGLRPAVVGGWLVEAWPAGAAAGLVAEARWAETEMVEARSWSKSVPVHALASELAGGPDPWVDRVATFYGMHYGDPEEQERQALDVLATDPDPLMIEMAVGHLRFGRVPLDAATDALVRRVARERPEHAAQLGVFAVRAALRDGDVGLATSFLPQIEEGARHLRVAWLVEPIDRGLHKLRGQLAARGQGRVDSWQAGLVVVAHRCAASETETRKVLGIGIYDGGWRWHWADDDAFTRCMTSTEPPGPRPPPGQRLELEVIIRL